LEDELPFWEGQFFQGRTVGFREQKTSPLFKQKVKEIIGINKFPET